MSNLQKYVYLSQISVLLPVVAGWIYYKKLNYPFRILFYFLVACIGVEIQASVTRIIFNNNMPGLHIFTIIQFFVFSGIFYIYMQKNSGVRFLILINLFVALAIGFIDAFYVSGLREHNALSRSYSSASMVVYALIYLFLLFKRDTTHYSWEYPLFWVCIGLLFYSACNIQYYMLKSYLLNKEPGIEKISYYVFLSSNIIAHCFFAQSFRCFRKWKEVL